MSKDIKDTNMSTPIRQIKKVSIDEVPGAPSKNNIITNSKLSVDIPKFNVNFDDKNMSEHETRMHRKTSYWNSEEIGLSDNKK